MNEDERCGKERKEYFEEEARRNKAVQGLLNGFAVDGEPKGKAFSRAVDFVCCIMANTCRTQYDGKKFLEMLQVQLNSRNF